LLNEKLKKEIQVKDLIGKTTNDLWNADLDVFAQKWDEFEQYLADLESQEPSNKTQAMGKKKAKTALEKVKKGKKKDGSDDSESDDYEKVKKTVARKVKTENSSPSPKKAKISDKPAKMKQTKINFGKADKAEVKTESAKQEPAKQEEAENEKAKQEEAENEKPRQLNARKAVQPGKRKVVEESEEDFEEDESFELSE
jgi:hypothetical protein